jgi:Fur family iron response transcriptional regulator
MTERGTTAETSAAELMARAGLRPTRQRLALADVLFAKGSRHLTAEALHGEAARSGVRVSLATVYNTLNAFTDAGLVRQVAVDGARVYFDTNLDAHHHFFNEETGELTDIPAEQVAVAQVPDAPQGAEIARVDVVVRIKPNG